MIVLVALVTVLPVSELALSFLNTILTTLIPPRPLPKLALGKGVPDDLRTVVAVPTILSSASRVKELVDALEVRALANHDENLRFALLGDLPDADAETTPSDHEVIDLAVELIAGLNARYGPSRFYLLSRRRTWNPSEGRWMGWERKRGKLHEFNRVLRGAVDTTFDIVFGDLTQLQNVRYVITLDSDTDLPLDAGRKLVGTLAHPLNRARFDGESGRITQGYAVLQPRVAIGAVSAAATTFSLVFSGHVGLDPYTTAVSDVYQDLFGEGSYVGKGIYDVDAFERALNGRVPDNALLSHDLFEGLFARVALCTDLEVIDDFPSHYLTWVARLHRWVRGDWQLLPWLGRTVPTQGGGRASKHAVRRLALEDSGQPPAKPAPAGVDRPADGRVARASRRSVVVDGNGVSGAVFSRLRAVGADACEPRAGGSAARSLPLRARQPRVQPAPGAPAQRVSRTPVDRHGRRHRANARASRHQAAPPRVGDGRRHGGAPCKRSGRSCCAGCGWPR